MWEEPWWITEKYDVSCRLVLSVLGTCRMLLEMCGGGGDGVGSNL